MQHNESENQCFKKTEENKNNGGTTMSKENVNPNIPTVDVDSDQENLSVEISE